MCKKIYRYLSETISYLMGNLCNLFISLGEICVWRDEKEDSEYTLENVSEM